MQRSLVNCVLSGQLPPCRALFGDWQWPFQVVLLAASLGGCVSDAGQPPEPKPKTLVGPAVPYDFDRARYDARLEAPGGASARAEILRVRWADVLRIVAYVSILDDPGFYKTLSQDQLGVLSPSSWGQRIDSDLTAPIEVGQSRQCRIEGDCLANIRALESGVVHILGDLSATVVVDGQGEIVIGGSVTETGRIVADGITKVLVGGDFRGQAVSSGSLMMWVHGSLTGDVETGAPSTDLHIMGDFTGSVRPHEKGALLAIDVHGFMAESDVTAILEHGYTDANFSIGISDVSPGVHFGGLLEGMKRLTGSWVVHRQDSQRALQDGGAVANVSKD